MNNYQFLLRFVKYYNLFHIKAVQNKLKIHYGLRENLTYNKLFNFINETCCWGASEEGRLFWEIQHYNLFKFFFETHQNKEEAKHIIQSEGNHYLYSGFFAEIKGQTNLWEEIEQFKNTINS